MENRILYTLQNYILTLIFCMAIFIPFSISFLNVDKEISSIEKRPLAKRPTLPSNINDIKNFPTSFNSYYADHFGLRDWLAYYYKLIKYNLGDSPSKDVIIGKDGWLFLGSIQKGYQKYSDPIGDARNINLYTQQELQQFAAYINNLSAWMHAQGLEYIFIIAPNKHTIYFEQLPDYITKANKYSATDQLINYLKKHTEVPIVDVRASLIQAKQKHILYYKTDTHWNEYAGNIAQYKIIQTIEKLFPERIHAELFKLHDKARGGGDLGNFIGIYNFSELSSHPIFNKSCTPQKYPADAEGGTTHSYTCDNQSLKAVIFRDSFFKALKPYFSRKFKHSTYIWKKLNYPDLVNYIALDQPDIIIEEWVERTLPYVPPVINEFNYPLNKKLFKQSKQYIFANEWKKLSYQQHLALTEKKHDAIQLTATDNDPIINFVALPLEPGSEYIVHIVMTSSIRSTLQLFYSDANTKNPAFSEEKSLRYQIIQGKNDIYLHLSDVNIGKYLRLDPITKAGHISFKTIEIKKIN
ncbi:MAG: alginate O-acetyltransferase complex protein AlgJ [Methyloprofundus sp.]|nr:MAG: alginate O-acetyltransferase complex protein AlgJ [Methyloprofundus sp.]